ncbi:carbohydrate-binding protein [Streptomyces collinus]|uniref:Serine protease n=1 Tax=Streptomyces collinus (strain DSM 40733 / Tue 365) TaxID=1214242 RepID=S5VTC8_STRC3|nr:alpha-lytic protease prodomain-containing protein [Streptomyces collinus]AGS71215.1 serine protease [Streptomyces collinus Tu 365]UJA09865.1 serine protease [Streptomyces collinus]UJA15271.1 serine protease [Streptomyces collinus]
MLHRHARAAGAAVAAAGALLVAGLSGSASAGVRPVPPTAPGAAQTMRTADAPPALLRAMRRDLGLTAPQARHRLVNEAEAGATAGRLRVALGARFAGAWVRGAESGTLTVATTDARDAAAIRARGARAVVVRHSLASLDAAKGRLDRAAGRHATTDTPVWYVDVRTNALVVQAVRPAAVRPLLAAAGVDPALVRSVKSAERPRPLYDLRGGDAYYIDSSTRCSIGFPVTRGTQQGFASAGHCGRAGSTTTGSNRVAQGTFQASVFPGNDMSWVAANGNWTATPYVNGSSAQVTGSTQATVGASVCRSGSTTGWHCGTVQQLNSSVTYQEGTVSGVTRTSVCAEPGDSGGSFISGSQAQGVTSGGSGDCTSGGTTFFQPVNPILQSYGLTLKTTASGPGDPGDPGNPGGTWSAGTVYQAGDTVTYGGADYRCLQGHQAQPGWEPPNVPALWQRV